MIKVTIPANYLLALQHLAPKKEVRYYLNGVAIIAKSGKISLVATDGKVMGCLSKTDYEGKDFSCILGNETLKSLSIFKGKEVDFVLHEGADGFVLKGIANGLVFDAIDGKFPDFERVLHGYNHAYNGQAAQLDIELLSKFTSVAKTLGNTKFAGNWRLLHNGASNSVGVYKNDATETGEWNWSGVIMPLRV
jgi:DNA polymerase III sliding clamp (beta) subunit (PCNA family)